jgi:hypothetical protein
MTKRLSEMTRTDWLTRRWINTTPSGSTEMMFTDAGDFPEPQRAVLLAILHADRDAEPTVPDNGHLLEDAANSRR